MPLNSHRPANLAAIAAALSMAATPAMAVELPGRAASAVTTYDGGAEIAHGWRGRGRGRHHDRGIDAGDVIAGVLVLGSIAAIASAASKSSNDRRAEERGRYTYPEDARYREPLNAPGYRSGGMGNAVDMCVDMVERSRASVAGVDSASRAGDGWYVSGETDEGALWSCRIGNDGEIDEVQIGDNRSASAGPDDYTADVGYYSTSSPREDNQYPDDVYYRARNAQRAGSELSAGEIDADLES